MHLSKTLSIGLVVLASTVAAIPQRRGGQTAKQMADKIPQGISKAKDGSTILDTTAMINGLPIRYRVSAPPAMFKAASTVPDAAAAPDATGDMGLNVLLHGDGGASFFDFPNQAVAKNLMGVVVLAPDDNLFWGGGAGLNRANGVEHAQAVNDLVQVEMPKVLAFNQSNVYFTGVSGGSLMLSGFFVPAQMKNFATGTGVMLMCGALPPQVEFQESQKVLSTTPMHYQSTVNELADLQRSIPSAIKAYEKAAGDAGMAPDVIGKMQTVDNTPVGGHCEFDGQGFNSGIRTVVNSYAAVMQDRTGNVPGVNPNVLKPVVGNENPTFGKAPRMKL